MTESKMTFRELLHTNWRGLTLLYSLIPYKPVFAVVYVILDVVMSYWSYFFLARFVDDIVMGASRETLVVDIVLLAAGEMIVSILFKMAMYYYFYGGSMTWEMANVRLNQKLMSMDYEYMESEAIQNRHRDIDAMARNSGGGLCLLFWLATPVLERTLQMSVAFGYMVYMVSRCRVAFAGEPLKAIGFACAFAGVFAALLAVSMRKETSAQKKIYQYNEDNLPGLRQYNFYVGEYIGREECGKTIRMFHQQGLLAERTKELFQGIHENIGRITAQKLSRSEWSGVIETVISGLVYLLMGIMAMKQAVTVGNICLFAGCIQNFLYHFRTWGEQWVELAENTKYVKKYFDFLDIPNKKYEGTLPVEKREDNRFEVEFRHVSFRYPGTDRDILKDFSIKFHIGERLAVVGRNGCGKTTFIKLLCRLYDPVQGEILLNGIDIRKYDYREYLSLFGVVFQDFKIPALPLGQNVAASTEVEEDRAREALRRAGLGGLLDKMPCGMDTPLYTDFDKNGVDISGGEAQKIAIARALYRDAPFVILDEPTAALDPIAEYEVYSKFDELVGSKTAVYISHRLSSCRFCNDILVIDEGRAMQRGSHDELIRQKGSLYETLWNAQAEYYHRRE